MTSSPNEADPPRARRVEVSEDRLTVELVDGRTISVPVSWYPRLEAGSAAERARWSLIGPGIGVHWSDLDEDIAVEDLLAGRRSQESRASLARWQSTRASRS